MSRDIDISLLFPDKWNKLRKDCLKRDNHKCQFVENGKVCGYKKKVQIHHIIRKSDRPDLVWDINNVIALCPKHHKYVTGCESAWAGVFANAIRKK